jgi:hypothetical protein
MKLVNRPQPQPAINDVVVSRVIGHPPD